MRTIRNLALAGMSLLALPIPAFASDAAPASADDAAKGEEIVVTGTLIRGIAPGGSQSIGVDQAKIESIGAANTSDLISAIPQAGTFNQFVGVKGTSNVSLAVNRPTLRYLGFTSSATASTLLLLDGHRLPGMGIQQNSADIDAIAAGAIERVEVVTDGGSSTYGSDAVGGVINFITRKEFDGVEMKANYGIGDNYNQANATITAGKKWDGGSAYISYDFSRHDGLLGEDRDWNQLLNWPLTAATGSPVGSSLNCTPGNISIGGVPFGLPGLSASSVNRCDNTDQTSLYSKETKHSLLASVVIDHGGPVSFSLKAFYVHRVEESFAGPLTANIAVPALITGTATPNPVYIQVPGQSPTATETFAVNFGPLLGRLGPVNYNPMESYGITPSIKWNIGGNWQLNAMFNYGRGKMTFKGGLINSTPLVRDAGKGIFNPANLGASGNAATIAEAVDWFNYGRAVNEMVNARVVADGPLLKLPGGDLRVALGAEYMHESYTGFVNRTITTAGIAAATDRSISRNVKSVFGEINLPVIGADNRSPLLYSLSLTASARYDSYSDPGHTFNPKFGINYEPTEWLRLRANWGKAFQEPGLFDIFNATSPSANALPTTLRPFFDPATPIPTNGTHKDFILAFGGTTLPLTPQKAKTWSVGFDIKPPASGFSAGMTYYNIDFKGLIGPAPIQLTTFYKNFADHAVLYTAGNAAMAAYVDQLVAATGLSAAAKANMLAQFGGNYDNVYSVLDARTANQSGVKTSGLDFYLHYTHDTHFGDIYFDWAGTRILTLAQGGSTAVTDVLGIDVNGKLHMSTTVGAHVRNLQAQVSWFFNDGVNEIPNAANLQQSRVSSFSLFNLFFKYSVPGDSAIAKDLSFTLNVDNVFNTDPPLYRGLSNSLNGVANGFTLGRIVKFGISKKF